jgi:hypothetical protein
MLIVAAVNESRAQNQAASQSTRWEYSYMGIQSSGGYVIIMPSKSFRGLNWPQLIGNYRGSAALATATSLDVMNLLGADGWELVEYSADVSRKGEPDFSRLWILKRPAK